MSAATQAAITQLEDLLDKVSKVPIETGTYRGEIWKTDQALEVRLREAIRRFAPPNSQYVKAAAGTKKLLDVERIAQGLLDDYKAGYLASIAEIVHASVFADILGSAQHLLDEHYKDAAAVMIGAVLEQHLRELCTKNAIDIEETKPNGDVVAKKASRLNDDLKKAGAFDALDHASVNAWLKLRNSAAHGLYSAYSEQEVVVFMAGVRGFMQKHPA